MREKACHGGKVIRVIMAVLMGLIIATAISLVLGALVMVLWNWLMPSIFELGEVTYWQAFGLSLLAKLLLCGFGKHFMGGPGARRWQGRHWHDHAKYKDSCKGWRFDDVYEEWWEKEGSERFKDFMNKRKDDEEIPEDPQ